MVKSLIASFCFLTLACAAQDALAKGCCLPDGGCINTSKEDCDARGGTFNDQYDCGSEHLGCGAGCRVTGGGVDKFGNPDGTYCDAHNGRGSQTNRYTFGGQAGAPTAEQPQPYGEWTHHQQSGPSGDFVFHAGTSSAPEASLIASVECSDPGQCVPANPGPAKQIDFDGVGIFHNIRNAPPALSGVIAGVTVHWFEVHIEDLGEPGRNGQQHSPGGYCPPGGSAGALADCRCPDFYKITIHANIDPASEVIYQVYGYIDGGNLQIHPAILH